MLHEPFGDILVFMPTIALVDRTVAAINGLRLEGLEVVACHAQMDDVESRTFRHSQQRAQKAATQCCLTVPQRVIVSTNYAETSVTFANLKYVIDTGLISEPHWDPLGWCKDQRPRPHTRAGCWQRRGRVGRTAPGEVFHLYEEADLQNTEVFREYPLPEVRRSRLDSAILTLAASGMPYAHLRFLGEQGDADGAARKEIDRAVESLKERGAFDADGDPTDYGLALAGLETSSAEAAAFMLESSRFACSLEAATFLAFVDCPLRPFLRNARGELAYAEWSKGCRDDLEFYLRIYHNWEQAKELDGSEHSDAKGGAKSGDSSPHAKWVSERGLNHAALLRVTEARARLLAQFTRKTHTRTDSRLLDVNRLHKTRFVLAKTLADWIYVRTPETDIRSGVNLYKPLSSRWVAADERISISSDSACFCEQSPDAFIAMERSRGRLGINCRHVVSVALNWVDSISHANWLTAGRAAEANLVREVMMQEAEERGLTAQIVTSSPTLESADVKSYRQGELFTGIVIRPTLDQEESPDVRTVKYLVEDAKSGKFVVIQLQGSAMMSMDAVFRAHVISIDAQARVLNLSQESIRREVYAPGESTELPALVRQELLGEDGKLDAYVLELEPGITGIYRLRDGEHRAEFVESIAIGGSMDVAVKRNSNGKINFSTSALPLEQGRYYIGEIVKMLDGGHAALVRIGPAHQQVGLLHRNTVPSDMWSTLVVRNRLRVYLARLTDDGNRVRLQLNWAGQPN